MYSGFANWTCPAREGWGLRGFEELMTDSLCQGVRSVCSTAVLGDDNKRLGASAPPPPSPSPHSEWGVEGQGELCVSQGAHMAAEWNSSMELMNVLGPVSSCYLSHPDEGSGCCLTCFLKEINISSERQPCYCLTERHTITCDPLPTLILKWRANNNNNPSYLNQIATEATYVHVCFIPRAISSTVFEAICCICTE